MQFKYTALIAATSHISASSAHSWLGCTNHDSSQILAWMQGNSTLSPPVIIDPGLPWFSYQCSGWPRAKQNPGNWIDESTNYAWNIAANSWDGGAFHPPDTHACHPSQRTPTYAANAPMVSARAGDTVRLRFGGNGHARGFNSGGDPGTVSVYWKGGVEREIVDIAELTPANLLQSQGFSDDAFMYPANPAIKTPIEGLVDKGNWMNLKLPGSMAAGRHMMAWVWYFKGPDGKVAPQWSTCFDVMVLGGSGQVAAKPQDNSSLRQEDIPQTPVAPAPVPVASSSSPPSNAAVRGRNGYKLTTISPVATPVPASVPAPVWAPAQASPPKGVLVSKDGFKTITVQMPTAYVSTVTVTATARMPFATFRPWQGRS